MKKLLALSLLTITMSLTSCSHMGMGCCKSGSQCNMKKEECEKCCKDKAQCPMKSEGHETHEAATPEVKK